MGALGMAIAASGGDVAHPLKTPLPYVLRRRIWSFQSKDVGVSRR